MCAKVAHICILRKKSLASNIHCARAQEWPGDIRILRRPADMSKGMSNDSSFSYLSADAEACFIGAHQLKCMFATHSHANE